MAIGAIGCFFLCVCCVENYKGMRPQIATFLWTLVIKLDNLYKLQNRNGIVHLRVFPIFVKNYYTYLWTKDTLS